MEAGTPLVVGCGRMKCVCSASMFLVLAKDECRQIAMAPIRIQQIPLASLALAHSVQGGAQAHECKMCRQLPVLLQQVSSSHLRRLHFVCCPQSRSERRLMGFHGHNDHAREEVVGMHVVTPCFACVIDDYDKTHHTVLHIAVVKTHSERRKKKSGRRGKRTEAEVPPHVSETLNRKLARDSFFQLPSQPNGHEL